MGGGRAPPSFPVTLLVSSSRVKEDSGRKEFPGKRSAADSKVERSDEAQERQSKVFIKRK